MRNLKLFVLFTAASVIVAISCSRPPALPDATISAVNQNGKLSVVMQVPERHHAYLDSGRDGNLIPVTFDWKNLGLLEADLQSTEMPSGELEPDTGARVLRGEGRFSFELPQSVNNQAQFRVRVQICDEVKGICYRPVWHEVQPKS
ncbi:MAG: hypothetical protein H3C43_09290 [Leptonema sp. (in: Bacteria)]|nr:hypothetical protein [Leptonema sp. (in: bacteria)]